MNHLHFIEIACFVLSLCGYCLGNDWKKNGNFTELNGGTILGERILRLSESPYLLQTDIYVNSGAELVIEAGVVIYVAPMVGVIVKGSLRAIGTAENRIIFTSKPDSGYTEGTLSSPVDVKIRLIDGPTPLEGRLQFYFQNKWRSICTNSRNWTEYDYGIACRQMGFQGGRFWNWVERTPGYEPRILYEDPNCKGTESSLLECAWSSLQMGSGVCDYHSDIGIQCLPLHDKPLVHWKGIQFLNSPVMKHLENDNTVYTVTSKSQLKYVDIIRAGSGTGRLTTSAIEVIGVPPKMDHISIDHSAYTGINITRPSAGFSIRNTKVQRSKGIGIFVNSSYGLAHFEGCNVEENGADGIKYVSHDLRSSERTDRTNIYDFCTLPTTAGQTFPISVSLQQSFYAATSKECSKYFFTRPGYVLTINFEYFTIKENETAQIDIYDGASANDRRLTSWLIRNSTRLQSVTTTKDKVFIRFNAKPRSDVLGFLRLTTGIYKTFDINITNSIIEDNGGRGVITDNIKTQIYIKGSSLSNNGHVAGLHVVNGAGDINITESQINFNKGDGINITYYGGNRNISKTTVGHNLGYGIAIWLNETIDKNRMEFVPINQTTVLEYSNIYGNIETGIRHGNFCGNSWINITGNHFNGSKSNDIDIQTCWFDYNTPKMELNLQIGHNRIENSFKNGIIINPALNLIGIIEYNQFLYGKHGAVFIKNQQYEAFLTLPVKIRIQHNHFLKNNGIFVVSLGLSPYSDHDTQWILFTRNFVRDNYIKEPFGPIVEGSEGFQGAGRLNPRSMVSAAIVISSSNVDVFRNIISNKQSKYEVGSQLSDQSKTLNVTYNWLGHTDEEKIFNRLFHRKDRYNLANIEYIPYLLHNSNPGSSTITAYRSFVPKFYSEGSEYIGGEVDGEEIIPTGSYTVNRDINIRPGGKLILNTGVTLNFEPSVGIMVAGKLEARGRRPDDILLTLKRETIISDFNETDTVDVLNDADTETPINVNEIPEIPVRLLGGSGNHEGRLQIYVDNRWGTVCDYGWTMINAALVCHHLGYALNPYDWRLERYEIPQLGTNDDVIVSNVRCSEHDIDIRECQSERLSRGEFFNSCSHENDVGVRCYEGAWAGLRFSVLAERSDLQYITVEKAGLFDYTSNTFKPAVQMDLARHNLENVRVVDNSHDGLGIIYSDIYAGKSVNNVKNSEFINNRGNGISMKQLGLSIQGSIIKDNLGSGVEHNSVISAIEQRELAGWFKLVPELNMLDVDYKSLVIPLHTKSSKIILDHWQTKHIITEKYYGDEITKKIEIKCQPGHVIGIQLINPIENRSTENIYFVDSQTESSHAEVWDVKRDLSVFPITSSSYGLIMHYKSGTKALGGTVFLISTIPAPVQNIRNRIVRGAPPTLQIKSTKIQRNLRGITANYYNRYIGERGEHYLRKSNETIKIIKSEISYNKAEAVFINAPFWDVHLSNLTEVTFHINSSTILKNGQGIRHFAKDLRSSNNIFHYAFQDTIVEDNDKGGLDISLPFVWQYNENFTHSLYIGNVTWRKNNKFKIAIKGHYAMVNITSNIFSDNNCENGLISLQGMEKKIKINQNIFEGNNGQFILEFSADSLSEIIGEVPAVVEYNEIKNNEYSLLRYNRVSSTMRSSLITIKGFTEKPTSVIQFSGIQKVKIYRNLIFLNSLDYDLVAGVRSARLNNFLIATENWWGSINTEYILTRIFDFDDWNNHAEVLYRPYLIESSFDASVSVTYDDNLDLNLDNIGGKIIENLIINKRNMPYLVRSDITIMPDVTLTINHGVIMEFAPNVGILVLGTLRAVGYKESPIILREISNITYLKSHQQTRNNNNFKRSLNNELSEENIRLCTGRTCSSETKMHEGFLEYFNHTTLQWVPICDRRFTERNAQVVCRELGYDPLDVYYGHDRRLEFHTNSLTRIWSWMQPIECRGDENMYNLCPERLNGQLYGRRHECHWNDEFVFVSCNGNNTENYYWGGIRFANSEFEQNLYEHRVHDIHTHGIPAKRKSHLEFVEIVNAGLLHGEKSAAIQSVFKNPVIQSVSIINSAHHGINLISPTESVNLKHLNIENVMGNGINIISLTGEGRESQESSFTPMRSLDLPYHIFSMIDICDTSKEITIEERVLLYYKYDNNPVNCVKIFKSAYRAKPLGFRLLQSNLFNHSKEYGRTDAIYLYDGDIYNITSNFINKIEANSGNDNKFFKTVGPVLSVRLIASGAPSVHGFIAEVVTVPISTIGYNRDSQHNISNSEIINSVHSAISYTTVGEVSPILTLTSNRFIKNCRQLYGNFSTCEAAINVDVQNMQSLFFMNNLVELNQGGLYIRADSRGSATSLRGWINNNLFVNNKNRPALKVEGRQSSPYQEVIIYSNYLSQNKANYEDVICLRQVVSNFTYNYVHSNFGGRILVIAGFDKVRLPIYQTTAHNGFYDNVATDWSGRATIVAGTAGQQYVDNIFYNPDNDYEMITINRSIFEYENWNSTLETWKTKIDARYNYWSYNETISVASRIRDRSDDPLLLEVNSVPFHMNNKTILDKKCPPGWALIGDTCYIYVGSPMTFDEAKEFCRSDNASMPFIRSDTSALWAYLQQQMKHLKYPNKVWIQNYNHIEKCTSFTYRNVEIEECNDKLGFLCEIDPKVVIDPLSWRADIYAISILTVFILSILILMLIAFCWYAKSKHRHVQRMQRRNSIRQSLRSLNSIDQQGSLRRRNFHVSVSTNTLTKSAVMDYKKMTSNGSIDSMDKSVLSSEASFDTYEGHSANVSDQGNRQPKVNDNSNQHKKQKNSIEPKTATVSSRGAGKSKVYGIPNFNSQVGYDLSYRNEGFRDNSTISGTRNNSIVTTLTDETPIMHQTDIDELSPSYFETASTLPLRSKDENLSFLSELKQRLPEYDSYPKQGHSSFLSTSNNLSPSVSQNSGLPYDKKIDKINFSNIDNSIERPHHTKDMKRPDSYYTAVRSSKAPENFQNKYIDIGERPKTVYESSENPPSYTRSKSEVLLETNFDRLEPAMFPLQSDNRSYSQPLETAM